MPAAASPSRLSRGLWLLPVVALLVHLGLGLARVPGVVFGRRWSDIDDYRARGAAGYFLGGPALRGAEVVQWILANVPADAAVLFRGETNGALEFVPGLIAPRLLVREQAVAADAREHRGRPLARRTEADGQQRPVVVVGLVDDLRLEVR